MQRDPNIHRELHALEQGTPAWDAYRANHDNASDAPAMMSCSPYKTRSELIRQYATGISPEIDARTQKLFDDGHRFEALARDHVAQLGLIDMELYPNIASLGRLSASYDGLTMCESIVWEHKSLNNDIRACETAVELPLMYRIQMEQQMHIVGAEKALFLATRWDEYGNILEEKHFWYEPDMALRQQIILGWEQFAIDVTNYVPAAQEVQHIAAPALALPALVIRTRGEVTQSNLPAFKAAAEQFLAGIKTKLETDEDFINADQAVKDCEKAEGDIEQAKKAATTEMATVDDVLRVADQVKEIIRARRLLLSKLIDTEKLRRKETILNEGKREYVEHIAKLEAEIVPLRLALPQPDFAGAMKGKRTIKGSQDAVSSTLANAKIAANQQVADYLSKLVWLDKNASDYNMLFPPADMQHLVAKALDDFQLVVRTRIDAHKSAEARKAEELRVRIVAEEKAKADAVIAEAARLARIEAGQLAAAAVDAERARVAEHNRTAGIAAADQRATEQASANVAANMVSMADHGRLAHMADAQKELAAAKVLPNGTELSPGAAALYAQEGSANYARAHTPPTLRLGQISERLGFTVTASFMESMGFAPADTDKAAKLFHEADFPSMCAALCRHISAVQAEHSV